MMNEMTLLKEKIKWKTKMKVKSRLLCQAWKRT